MLPLALLFFGRWALSFFGGATGVDVGEKLFLTPYIEQGKIEQGRSLARVPPLKGDVVSYSGFVNVDKKCDSNMFFWYFPAVAKTPGLPVIVWLQGGPGATAMYGVFTEIGPYLLDEKNNLTLNDYSWTRVANLLFVDNPVGTGFSFTKDPHCYSQNEVDIGQKLLTALKQIFKLFPEVASNPLVVSGESYGGKYVPALAYAIHKDRNRGSINLAGLTIGNGVVDPSTQSHYSDYLFLLGLVDERGRNELRSNEEMCRKFINKANWIQASLCFNQMIGGALSPWPSKFTNLTGYSYYFNFLHTISPPETNISEYMDRHYVRKSIHVGDAVWHESTDVQLNMALDLMQSVRPWLEELLESYPVMIYNGQFDIITAYPMTVEYINKMKWSGARAYRDADRVIWRVNGEVAGYVKTAGKLTEIMIRNAGHLVPTDQPQWALEMITKFLQKKPFN